MDRGEGRNRSEIPDLNARIKALDEALVGPQSDLELLFTVESYAWAILQRSRAELFERRLEMPKSDADIFSSLQRAGLVDLVEARQLRQFCEARNLASRDFNKIDISGVRQMAQDRTWIADLLTRFKERSPTV